MKVQLFIPPRGYVAQRWAEGNMMPSLGILYLSAVLEREGIDVDVVPADVLGYDWEDIIKRIESFKPDILGVTTTTENRFDSFKLVALAKQLNRNIITMLGGPHISMAKEDTLNHVKDVDILCIGEGEKTIIDLVAVLKNDESLSKIKGIFYRDSSGKAVFTGKQAPIESLDTLPFPARHLIPMEKYNFDIKTRDGRTRKTQNIITSRGCPFNCYFCSTPVNWGRRMRGHSPERVLEEIEHLIDRFQAEYIWFYDDTLNYNPSRLHKIMDMIIERKLGIKFTCELRIDLVDKPMLEKMKEAGLELGSFGIEAGNSRIRQDVVRKKFDIKRAFQFVQWSKELDFIPGPFFIFSHHTETWKEAQETLEVIEKVKSINPLADISSAILHVYPGTHLESIAKREGIIPKNFSWATEKDMRRVYALPAAQGYVPLFKDKLTWWQIANLGMRWSTTSEKKISVEKMKNSIVNLKSTKDVVINFIFFIVLIKFKAKKLFGKLGWI